MAPLERAVIRNVPKVKMPVPAQLPKGWSKAAWMTSLGSCRFVIEMNGTKFETDDLGDACIAQGAIDRRSTVTMHDRWLVITTSHVRPATDTLPAHLDVMLHVCTTASDGKPMCSWALPLASITHHERDEVEWQLDYKLEPDAITLSTRTGEVPQDVRQQLGRHRLPRWHYSD